MAGGVTTTSVGADISGDGWLAGALVARSSGSADWRGNETGEVESALTGIASAGFSVDVAARRLVAHSAGQFRHWGMSATISWQSDPTWSRGPQIRAGRRLGLETAGSVAAIFGQAADGMSAVGPVEASVEGEAGYGMRSFSDRLTATPARRGGRVSQGAPADVRVPAEPGTRAGRRPPARSTSRACGWQTRSAQPGRLRGWVPAAVTQAHVTRGVVTQW